MIGIKHLIAAAIAMGVGFALTACAAVPLTGTITGREIRDVDWVNPQTEVWEVRKGYFLEITNAGETEEYEVDAKLYKSCREGMAIAWDGAANHCS